MLYIYIYIYIYILASVRFEHSVCRGSLMTSYIYAQLNRHYRYEVIKKYKKINPYTRNQFRKNLPIKRVC